MDFSLLVLGLHLGIHHFLVGFHIFSVVLISAFTSIILRLASFLSFFLDNDFGRQQHVDANCVFHIKKQQLKIIVIVRLLLVCHTGVEAMLQKRKCMTNITAIMSPSEWDVNNFTYTWCRKCCIVASCCNMAHATNRRT
jgi:hypothetical protein